MKIEIEQDVASLRRAEYEARGLSFEALTVALIEEDKAEISRIQAERAAIKKKFPKVERNR